MPERPHNRLLFAVAVASVALVAAAGADLEALKRDYEDKLAKATLPEYRRYLGELVQLENSLVAAKDYSAAVHVQRERLRINARIESLGATAPTTSTPPPATGNGEGGEPGQALLASGAATGGGVRLDSAGGTLVGWDTAGGFAEWPIPESHLSGGYEVVLDHTGGGGTFLLRETFYTLTRTPDAENDGPANIGTLRMRKGPGTLRLELAEAADGSSFALRSIRLLPASR